jgi:hypothetical protein
MDTEEGVFGLKGFAWLMGIAGLVAVALGVYGMIEVAKSGYGSADINSMISFSRAFITGMDMEMGIRERLTLFAMQYRIALLLGGILGFVVAILLGKAAKRA